MTAPALPQATHKCEDTSDGQQPQDCRLDDAATETGEHYSTSMVMRSRPAGVQWSRTAGRWGEANCDPPPRV